MWMQTINKSDTERVWVNFINAEAQTVTCHYPVFLFVSDGNPSSVGTNEAGLSGDSGKAVGTNAGLASFIGLAYEDVPKYTVGIAQVYGYHESFRVDQMDGCATIRPGYAMGPAKAGTSVGLSSVGALQGVLGPVAALDTVTGVMTSLGQTSYLYGNHCFLRCM